MMAEKTRAGLVPGPNGELPLDIVVCEVIASPNFMWMLMPKPKRAAAPKAEAAHKAPTKKQAQRPPPPPPEPTHKKEVKCGLSSLQYTALLCKAIVTQMKAWLESHRKSVQESRSRTSNPDTHEVLCFCMQVPLDMDLPQRSRIQPRTLYLPWVQAVVLSVAR